MDRGIILGFRRTMRFDLIYKSDSTVSRKYGFPDYCIFAKFHHAQGVSQPCASVSQLPAALRRPQKKHAPGFWNMHFVIVE